MQQQLELEHATKLLRLWDMVAMLDLAYPGGLVTVIPNDLQQSLQLRYMFPTRVVGLKFWRFAHTTGMIEGYAPSGVGGGPYDVFVVTPMSPQALNRIDECIPSYTWKDSRFIYTFLLNLQKYLHDAGRRLHDPKSLVRVSSGRSS